MLLIPFKALNISFLSFIYMFVCVFKHVDSKTMSQHAPRRDKSTQAHSHVIRGITDILKLIDSLPDLHVFGLCEETESKHVCNSRCKSRAAE